MGLSSDNFIKAAKLGKHHLQQSKEFLVSAESLYKNKEFSKALSEILNAIECNPHSVSAWVLCSRCFIDSDEYYHAVKVLEFASSYHPTIRIFQALDELYSQNKDVLKRVKIWKKYAKEFPGHHQGYLELSKIYFKAKNYSSVIHYARLGLKIKSELIELREILCIALEHNSDIKDALFEWRKILEYKIPVEKRLETMDSIIRLSAKIRDFELACNVLRDKIALSSSAEDLERLADLCIRSNRPKDALESLKEASQINPLAKTVPLKGAAISYFVLNKKKDSADWLQKALKADPDMEDIIDIIERMSKKEDVTESMAKLCEMHIDEDILNYSNDSPLEDHDSIYEILSSIFFRLESFENRRILKIIESVEKLSNDLDASSRGLKKNIEFSRELIKFNLSSVKGILDEKIIDEKRIVDLLGSLRSTLYKKSDMIEKSSEKYKKSFTDLFLDADAVCGVLEDISNEVSVLHERSKRILILPLEVRKKEIIKLASKLDEMIKVLVDEDE